MSKIESLIVPFNQCVYVPPTQCTYIPIDPEAIQLAAMVYGEASTKNDYLEMYALASVLVRQRDARGYDNMTDFAYGERSYSFVVSDGNHRYQKFRKSSNQQILDDTGMSQALAAAFNALQGGPDFSNGAYFWDGADIKTNYKHHWKVINGIKFTSPDHNIYHIPESKCVVIKAINKRKWVNGKLTTTKEILYRYDYLFESTAAYGGTIFWRFNRDYIKYAHGREYI